MDSACRVAERLMRMSDRVRARHANPWFCYTCFTALPLIAPAIWSRVWLGRGAWLAVAAVLIWVYADWLSDRGKELGDV